MKKIILINAINNLNNTNNNSAQSSLIICFLKQFINCEDIKKLNSNDNISFRAFLLFLQKKFSSNKDIIDLFKPPYFARFKLRNRVDKETDLILGFINEDEKPLIITTNARYGFAYQLKKKQSIKESISGLAILANGNILTSTCYFNYKGILEGKITLRNKNLQPIKVLTNTPASALAAFPDGRFLSSTCYINSNNFNGNIVFKGSIVLHDAEGNFVKTLVNEPASSMTIVKDKIVTSTYCQQSVLNSYGKTVLRDCNGNVLKKFGKIIASTITALPNNDLMTGCYQHDSLNYHIGHIELYDSEGEIIRRVFDDLAVKSMVMAGNNHILANIYSMETRSRAISELAYFEPKFMPKSIWPITDKSDVSFAVNELLFDMAAVQCMQFYKGCLDNSSMLSWLPKDLLKIIFGYVFRHHELAIEVADKSQGFPYATNYNLKKELLINEFFNKLNNFSFFSPNKSSLDQTKTVEGVECVEDQTYVHEKVLQGKNP